MIYLDNAATTRACKECVDALNLYATEQFFNPSALYGKAVECAATLNVWRDELLKPIHAPLGSLIFTASGSEANNLAMFGSLKGKSSKIIVPQGEHDSVFNTASELKARGYDVAFAPIASDGSVDLEKFGAMLTPNTTFVSVMTVSNETGAINDLATIVKMTKAIAPRALVHTDCVQAYGKVPLNLRQSGVDMASFSAHKIHGLKGTGALYVKNGVNLKPIIFGGGQEKGLRSGTENVGNIAAFVTASQLTFARFEESRNTMRSNSDLLKQLIVGALPDTVIISPQNGAPHILTVAFEGVRGEVLLHALEKEGVIVGIGSACSSHHESRFKQLLGLDETHKEGIVRFSLSFDTTTDEIKQAASAVVACCNRLKEIGRV